MGVEMDMGREARRRVAPSYHAHTHHTTHTPITHGNTTETKTWWWWRSSGKEGWAGTLFFWEARPIKDEWKMRPYFGVFPLVFSARNSAFSAPRI